MLSLLGKNSTDYSLTLLFFPEIVGHVMQIVSNEDNLYEITSLFSGKISLSSVEFAHGEQTVKQGSLPKIML